MDTRKRYCFDIDGVVADFNNAFCNLLDATIAVRTPRPHDFPTDWDWANKRFGEKRVAQAWDHIRRNPTWWFDLRPRVSKDSLDKLAQMSEGSERIDICFLTSRSLCPSTISQKWINQHIGPYAVTSVDIYSDKIPVLMGLKPLAYIDDHQPTIDLVRGMTSGPRAYLADQPYNAGKPTVDINTFIYEAFHGRV